VKEWLELLISDGYRRKKRLLMAKEFKTDNLALCPYLELNGLKYLRSELSLGKNDKPVVCFIFEDKLGIGRDLELDFVRSDEKRYRDLLFFFRNEIEKLKRKLDRINLNEIRKKDEKYFGQPNEDEQ
jgi:hypothetical protein